MARGVSCVFGKVLIKMYGAISSSDTDQEQHSLARSRAKCMAARCKSDTDTVMRVSRADELFVYSRASHSQPLAITKLIISLQ